MRTIVVGVGNPVLGDDGVGIHVIRALGELALPDDIVLEEAFTGGLALMDMLLGFDRVILIDAVIMEDQDPGSITVIDVSEMPSAHSANPHDVSFPEALELVSEMDAGGVPEDIRMVCINIEPATEFSEELSGPVEDAVEKAKLMVIEMLGI